MNNLFAHRIMHTMLRVSNPENSLRFYVDCLGMKILRREEHPVDRYSLIFIGYAPENEAAVLELTHNWDIQEYSLGSGYGHIALQVTDLFAVCSHLQEKDVTLIRPPGSRAGNTEQIAFIEDPDGYRIELIQRTGKNTK